MGHLYDDLGLERGTVDSLKRGDRNRKREVVGTNHDGNTYRAQLHVSISGKKRAQRWRRSNYIQDSADSKEVPKHKTKMLSAVGRRRRSQATAEGCGFSTIIADIIMSEPREHIFSGALYKLGIKDGPAASRGTTRYKNGRVQ